MGEVLAHPSTEAEGLVRPGADVGGLGVVGELRVDAGHQVCGRLDHRASRREAPTGVLGDLRDQGRPRGGVEVRGRSMGVEHRAAQGAGAHPLPRRVAGQGLHRRGMDIDRRARFDDQSLVGRIDHHGGGGLTERAGALVRLHRGGRHTQGAMHDRLARRAGRRQPQHAAGELDLRLVAVGRAVPDEIDHARVAIWVTGAVPPCRK